MLDKIVLYTVEKKSNRQIPMVLICRDSKEKDSGLVQVIFGSIKPGASRLDLLHFSREPIATKDYHLLTMDLYLDTKIRHTVFGGLNQITAWNRASNLADRFITRVCSMGPRLLTENNKFNKRYLHAHNNQTVYNKPPIAVLITNSNSLEKDLKRKYTSSKKNE